MFRFIFYSLAFYFMLKALNDENILNGLNGLNGVNGVNTVNGLNSNFNCHYAQLFCGCYNFVDFASIRNTDRVKSSEIKFASNLGGCSVKCSPSHSFTLYNQTYCPKIKDSFLAGFDI